MCTSPSACASVRGTNIAVRPTATGGSLGRAGTIVVAPGVASNPCRETAAKCVTSAGLYGSATEERGSRKRRTEGGMSVFATDPEDLRHQQKEDGAGDQCVARSPRHHEKDRGEKADERREVPARAGISYITTSIAAAVARSEVHFGAASPRHCSCQRNNAAAMATMRRSKNVSFSGCSAQRIVEGPNAIAASAKSARLLMRRISAQVARYARQLKRMAVEATDSERGGEDREELQEEVRRIERRHRGDRFGGRARSADRRT